MRIGLSKKSSLLLLLFFLSELLFDIYIKPLFDEQTFHVSEIFFFCEIEYLNGAVALETEWYALVVADLCVQLTA